MKHPTNRRFARCAIGVALSAIGAGAWAAGYYPSNPVSLSASVTPNIMLFIDTSGSMLQDQNNQWINNNLCNMNVNWGVCVNNNTNNYRVVTDADPRTKMNVAKGVARNLINANRNLRFGLASFQDRQASIGNAERNQAAIIRRNVGSVATNAERDTMVNAINGLFGRTATPLGEGLLEISRYFSGRTSLYGLNGGNAYVSPIQYRCQKNFAIVITDGDATGDQNLPGTNLLGEDNNARIPVQAYTARNSDGVAVAKNFSICAGSNAVADDGMNVTCPATYESDGTARTFTVDSNGNINSNGSIVNYPSALRDVAMYAKRADMRVGGLDADNKSFDDPKFSLQSLNTYTIGFAVNNPVLPSAARVGGGEYRTAGNEAQLTAALNAAIASMMNSLSNAGGVASSSTALQSGSQLFQPLYNPSGWYGELLCFDLNPTTGLATACANPKATIPAAASRQLFSSKVETGVTTPFVFNDSTGFGLMTAAQKTSLGTTAALQQEVINYVRGTNVAGYRARPKGLLGDMVDSQPLVIKAPTGETLDAGYAAFKTAQSARSMVFIGANDGMLHGFSTSNMAEFFGYIPSPVYPNLALLGKTDYGEAANPHAYFVNGVLRQQDVKLGSDWQTLLVGGLAQGGQGYFALNATSTSTLTAASGSGVKWEFTDQNDSDMGYSFGAPIIYTVRTSATTAVPAVILANGYEADYADGANATAKSSALYIVRASDGVLLRKIEVVGGEGLSSPVGVDFGQDGVLDYVYAGDINGKLWRFNLTGNTPANFGVASNPIFDAGSSKPIVLRPAVYPVNTTDINGANVSVGNLVLFGTGKLLTEADRTNADVQTFYAVLDKMADTPATIALSELQEQTITEETKTGVTLNGKYRVMSDNPVDLVASTATPKLGWYFNLPVSSERLMTAPIIVGKKVLLGTGITVSGEACSPGKGWLMGLNILTGGVVKSIGNRPYSFLDINSDNKTNDGDKLDSGNFGSGYELSGMPTELTFIAKTSSVSTISSATTGGLGAAGSAVALGDSNMTGVYTANAASGVSTGSSMGRPSSSGSGKLFVPVTDSSAVNNGGGAVGSNGGLPLVEPGAGVKLETTLWREIK